MREPTVQRLIYQQIKDSQAAPPPDSSPCPRPAVPVVLKI